ncbi:hypothetical protein BC830DRAFT_1166263 [Chytriomyces sp. MP71]|nr:hypothetical protein BC830DRAFT_1166263 [Chytriomyces sp. MP71]
MNQQPQAAGGGISESEFYGYKESLNSGYNVWLVIGVTLLVLAMFCCCAKRRRQRKLEARESRYRHRDIDVDLESYAVVPAWHSSAGRPSSTPTNGVSWSVRIQPEPERRTPTASADTSRSGSTPPHAEEHLPAYDPVPERSFLIATQVPVVIGSGDSTTSSQASTRISSSTSLAALPPPYGILSSDRPSL